MKNLCAALISLVLLTHLASAQSLSTSLPNAPIAVAARKPAFGIVNWSLTGAVIAGRALDFASTEECLRRPWHQCHEIELPAALVKNKMAFIAFEVGASALSTWTQYELTKHGHKRLGWVSPAVSVAFMSHTAANNYRLDTTPIDLTPTGTRSANAPKTPVSTLSQGPTSVAP